MHQKVKSCLITGFLGDAFGSKFELSDIPAGDDRWSFTDDTQLTAATCESLLANKGLNLRHLGQTFAEWYQSGRIQGIGAPTLMAMVSLIGGAGRALSNGDYAATNDAAMRIAPLAFWIDPTTPEGQSQIRDCVEVTQSQEEAFAAALAVCLAIRVASEKNLNVLPFVIRHMPKSIVRTRLEELSTHSDLTIREVAKRFGNSPLAHESVPFALFAASQANVLGITGMMKAIASTGGDTDTNCSIAGQIAGAALGLDAISSEWMEKLQETEGFGGYYDSVKRFAELVNQEQGIQTLF